MIAISTYSGECDGLGYAAEMAGIEVAAYCEIDPKRRAKLAEKHPGKPIFESDEELTADAIHALGIYPNLLFGGPPCQPFSCAGAQRSTSDPRHRWPEMLRFIRECRPHWVVVENVGNFVNLALDIVWSDLEAEGYEVGPIVLPALAVGAPHPRSRCFVVAHTEHTKRRKNAASCGGVEGANPIPQREEGADRSQCGGTGLAYTECCRGENGISESEQRQEGDADQCIDGRSRGVADAIRERELQPERCIGQSRGWFVDSSESVVDTTIQRLQEPKQEPGHKGGIEPDSAKFTLLTSSGKRSTQPRLGRGADGLSDRLHAVMDRVSAELDEQMSHWPAWRGQEQRPWEPPRIVRGMPERKRRIESLGLAVVPWQAYPIFALIKEIDDLLEEDL